ncbi:uncharacterized protein LOC144887710 [Branchiostoma floridae x Branchiostoma japonicum]
MFMPEHCGDLLSNGVQNSGEYFVGYPQPFKVSCDMDTDGGGWTVIQRRQDGSVTFDKTWTEYEHGFGNPSGEYWLGLENIHRLTAQTQNELYIFLQDWEGNSRYARYSAFSVGDAGSNYQASLSGYTGDAGDDLTLTDSNGRHSIDGREFSTYDQDNDDSSSHCASSYGQGGWWYPTSCGYAMLNGQYLTGCAATCDSAQGIVWKSWKTYTYSLLKTVMMIRPDNISTFSLCQNNATLAPGPLGTGIYRCSCNMGWTGTYCDQDIDECIANDNICDHQATCTNTVGSFTCTCNTGYTGDGETCRDVDECDVYPDICDSQATCANYAGSFTCTCNSGFIGDGFTCEACTDFFNVYSNQALYGNDDEIISGLTGEECAEKCLMGTATVPEGECLSFDFYRSHHRCQLSRANQNTSGTTLGPDSQNRFDHYEMKDIISFFDVYANHTLPGNDDLVVRPATVNPRVCALRCLLGDGPLPVGSCLSFEVDDTNPRCLLSRENNDTADQSLMYTSDFDHFQLNEFCIHNPCFAGKCWSVVNGFTCTCDAGWEGDVCDIDIDECITDTDNCDTQASCTNTAGSFTCTCNTGYTGDGATCADVNECDTNTHNCHQQATCTNNLGSFACSCDAGFSGDGVNCTDIDECASGTNNCGPHATCTNTAGSFTCTCDTGYTGNGITCADENECDTNSHTCHQHATCTNTVGSFTCSCNSGFLGDGTTCADIDECENGSTNCDSQATCSNTAGSFTCTCNTRYTGDGEMCADIDECIIGSDNCDPQATCTNTAGSFTCTCNTGYTGDGVTCADINECQDETDSCHLHASCTNNPGSYSCACMTGFAGDGVTCTDIDECTSDAANCDVQASCTNIPGSFTCSCNTGYTGDGVSCTDVDECSANTDSCHSHATCTNTVGSFTCTCNIGFSGDGVTCTDINFCVSDPCWSGGTCVDGLTGYTCHCPAKAMGQNCETVVETDTCYRLSNQTLSHKDASTACENIGAHLVDIWEASEQQLVASFVQRKIGISHWTAMKSALPPILHSDGSHLSGKVTL